MATIVPPPEALRPIRTVADVLDRLGVPGHRILVHPAPGLATVDDLVAFHDGVHRPCELVDGVLVEKAMGFYESNLACVLIQLLMNFLDIHPLGIVTGEGGMMRLAPGLVRLPDVSFLAWDRFPDRQIPREPVPMLAPDLAVEVLSPSNTPAEMDRKLREYFDAGTRLVWYLDPSDRTVRVYTAPDQMTRRVESGTLDGGEVLPGFRLPIREWFERAERNPAGG